MARGLEVDGADRGGAGERFSAPAGTNSASPFRQHSLLVRQRSSSWSAGLDTAAACPEAELAQSPAKLKVQHVDTGALTCSLSSSPQAAAQLGTELITEGQQDPIQPGTSTSTSAESNLPERWSANELHCQQRYLPAVQPTGIPSGCSSHSLAVLMALSCEIDEDNEHEAAQSAACASVEMGTPGYQHSVPAACKAESCDAGSTTAVGVFCSPFLRDSVCSSGSPSMSFTQSQGDAAQQGSFLYSPSCASAPQTCALTKCTPMSGRASAELHSAPASMTLYASAATSAAARYGAGSKRQSLDAVQAMAMSVLLQVSTTLPATQGSPRAAATVTAKYNSRRPMQTEAYCSGASALHANQPHHQEQQQQQLQQVEPPTFTFATIPAQHSTKSYLMPSAASAPPGCQLDRSPSLSAGGSVAASSSAVIGSAITSSTSSGAGRLSWEDVSLLQRSTTDPVTLAARNKLGASTELDLEALGILKLSDPGLLLNLPASVLASTTPVLDPSEGTCDTRGSPSSSGGMHAGSAAGAGGVGGSGSGSGGVIYQVVPHQPHHSQQPPGRQQGGVHRQSSVNSSATGTSLIKRRSGLSRLASSGLSIVPPKPSGYSGSQVSPSSSSDQQLPSVSSWGSPAPPRALGSSNSIRRARSCMGFANLHHYTIWEEDGEEVEAEEEVKGQTP